MGLEGPCRRAAGVRDQDVDLTVCREGLIHDLLHVAGFGEIGAHGQDPPPVPLQGTASFFQGFGSAGADNQIHALCGKCFGHGTPNSCAGCRRQGGLSPQPEIHDAIPFT
jgi:hypothetical protein